LRGFFYLSRSRLAAMAWVMALTLAARIGEWRNRPRGRAGSRPAGPVAGGWRCLFPAAAARSYYAQQSAAERWSEADLEAAIVLQQEFILELGQGFAFVEREKRMIIDGEDFYLDLLFFHRRLRRLVAIELKLGRFKAEHNCGCAPRWSKRASALSVGA
jgi:hypothetical protein